MEYNEYIGYVSKFGLTPNKELTDKLLYAMSKKRDIYPWYKASITVFNLNKNVKNTNEHIDRNIEKNYNLISFVQKQEPNIINLYLQTPIFNAIFDHNFNKFSIKIKFNFKNKHESYLFYIKKAKYEIKKSENYELDILFLKEEHFSTEPKIILNTDGDELIDYNLYITNKIFVRFFIFNC